ncbi:MAG: hypothetical protein MI684_00140 [Chlorobiales bacterium]|nr:hypothetical protein [Chlorobiales bacterium]
MEVENVAGTIMAAEAGADIVQLEKLPHQSVREVAQKVKNINKATVIAAAGGINDANAEPYAAAGADVLVSSWMYFGKPADYTVSIRRSRKK